MMRMVLIAIFCLQSGLVLAVQPSEVLDDPVLERRARAISTLIRCPVCQGENIDDSNADIAKDLRLVVRERLLAGDSDDQVIDYLVARYGEFILFSPRARGINLVLWLMGPAALIAAIAGAGFYLRRRGAGASVAVDALSAEEEVELRRILNR